MTTPSTAPDASAHIPDLSAKIPKLIPRKRAPPQRNPSDSNTQPPPPPTPALAPPADLSNHTYIHPSRRILGKEDHEAFLKSETCELVQAWIFGLSDSVRGRAIGSIKEEELSTPVRKILRIIEEAGKVLDRCPPEDTGSRFGNPVFKTFLDEVSQDLPSWHRELGLTDESQIDELSTYLQNSFGNRTRIDYGSGHELNFFLWLLCLNRISLLQTSDMPSLVLEIFPSYLHLLRRIQESYYLEPAGSHGVWGLDDYQFLPFLFGSSQLIGHPYITPKSIHNTLVLEEESGKYLYLDQVAFVNSVKNVDGLRWHSPMLDDISSAKNWAKIEGGMRKMFLQELLGKLVVMQHFLFGSLIPATEGMSVDELPEEQEEEEGGEVKVFDDAEGKRHVHAPTGWGDCCGIRVPAAVGAEGEERKARGGMLRRVPFD